MTFKDIFGLLKKTYDEWSEDKASRLGAALAYYTIFSLAPLLIIVMAICSLAFGEKAAQGRVAQEIQQTVGDTAAKAIEDMIVRTHTSGTGTVATIIGIITLLFGALGVFVQLQDALNTIWKVVPKPGRGWKGIVQDRLLSFGIILVIGFLLLTSLAISALLEFLKTYSVRWLISSPLPGGVYLWQLVNGVVSFAFFTVLFATIYKVLPDVKIRWKDVWTGGVVTALLFTLGKFLIGMYLGLASATSAFGAAGSLVVVLLWVYYSSQILLFGAEFTRVYADRHGRRVVPEENAVALPVAAQARQGMPRGTDVQGAVESAPVTGAVKSS